MLQYFPNITGSLQVTGSVLVSGSITATGGIIVSGSIASASYSANSELLDNLDSTAFVFTSSFNTYSSSMSTRTTTLENASASLNTASGSFSGRVTTIESKYATTGSNIFTGAQTVCANITSTGTIIAQTLNVQQVTSSIVYSSGSNIFGCSLANTQQFTGSVTMTGSLNVFTAGTTPEFQVLVGGTTHGNALTDTHNVTGSLRITGSFNTIGNACITSICSPAIDVMPSGIGVSTLGGIMRVVTTGTSTGIAVGQSNSNRYTHFAANDIQVFNDDFFLSTRCAFPLSIGTCYTARLTFAATGVACFSCRVCTPAITITGCAATTIFEGYNQNTDDGNGLYIKAGGVNTGKYIMALESAAGCSRMIVLANGNVGIGTTNVPFGLTVYRPSTSQGDTSTNLLLFDTTSYATGVGGGISFGGYYDNTNSEIYTYGYVKGGKENSTNGNFAGYLSFGTRASSAGAVAERMRITSGGSVVFQCSLNMCNGGAINMTIPSGTNGGSIRMACCTGPNEGDMFLTGGSGNIGILIAGSGRVGIGTTTPSYALQVNGPSNSNAAYFRAGGTSGFASVAFSGESGTALGVLATTSTCIFLGRANGTIGNQFGAEGDIMINCANGNVRMNNSLTVVGSLSKGSGSFRIKHPLLSKKCTHELVHSFIEGPQADLIYSGRTTLTSGISCINIDCAARMTQGTFEALNRCVRVFTTNESSWDQVRGKVVGNILVIESQNSESTDDISWMVIGERQDDHMFETEWTDHEGRVITEPEVKES